MEAGSVLCHTVGLMEEPVAALYVMVDGLAAGLIAGKGKAFAGFQCHGKTELLCLIGMDIEKGYGLTKNLLLITIFQGNKMDQLADESCVILVDGPSAHVLQDGDQLLVGVDAHRIAQGALVHPAGHQAEKPDQSQAVVRTLVGDKDMMDFLHRDAHALQLPENGIASAAVYQKVIPVPADGKAGVIAVYSCSSAVAEYI